MLMLSAFAGRDFSFGLPVKIAVSWETVVGRSVEVHKLPPRQKRILSFLFFFSHTASSALHSVVVYLQSPQAHILSPSAAAKKGFGSEKKLQPASEPYSDHRQEKYVFELKEEKPSKI